MTNAKSTLAVTAIILGGLVAASPFPYPRAPEAQPRRVIQAVAPDLVEPAAAGGWVDPPAKSLAVSETPAVAETAASTVPDMQAPVAAAEAPSPAQPATSKPADRTAVKLAAKRAEQAKRRKLAQAASRRQAVSKQAAATGGAPEEQTVASAAPAAAPADPITSLLRGLGFGRQG